MLAVINVALRRRIGGVAGLANSEHLNASVHCDRGHYLCEAQDCLQGKQWFEPYVFIIKNSYYVAVLWWRQQGSNL